MRVGIALAFVAAVACGAPSEFQVRSYSTLEAARSDRLFERGWVPDVLPGGSGPIVEAHDLDSNARCSRSEFPSEASLRVLKALRASGFEPFSGEFRALPFSECPFSLEEVRSAESALLNPRGEDLDREFAVVADGVLYFWSAP